MGVLFGKGGVDQHKMDGLTPCGFAKIPKDLCSFCFPFPHVVIPLFLVAGPHVKPGNPSGWCGLTYVPNIICFM
jgi:hypothetical protein